ncbi:hypothetical protein E4T56_gene636 [Termitomyces sp. T112]|nr:hypothetical protein E4T56_gene636 [Termitomyces sp. T112]
MSVYNPVYNPASYLTDVYGWPVPENPYTLFYPGPPADQTDLPTLISRPPMSMPLHPIPMSQSPQDSPWAPGHPDYPFPLTPLILHPFQCLILPPKQITLDPPPPEDSLPLNGP